MKHIFENIGISVIGCALPSYMEDIKETLLKNGVEERQAKRLIKTIGFSKLKIANDKYTSVDFCEYAIKSAVSKLHFDLNKIDGLIFVTQTPDYLIPGNAYLLQDRLSLRKDILIFDSIQGCSGFVHALLIASSWIKSNCCNNVLICCGDSLTPKSDLTQKGNVAIFGEGAGFAILSNMDGIRPSYFTGRSDGSSYEAIINYKSGVKEARQGFLFEEGEYLSGEALASYVLGDGGIEEVKSLLTLANLAKDDIEKFVCHQANKSMLQGLAMILDVDTGKVPFLSENTGNTSSASIPIAFSENKELFTNFDKYYVLSAFGTGLSSYSSIQDLSKATILEPVYLD